MTMSDPIADMLTRIRNASQARHPSCEMPHSRIKVAIAEVLRAEGYVDSFEERGAGILKVLSGYLRYAPGDHGRCCARSASSPRMARCASSAPQTSRHTARCTGSRGV